MENRAFGMGRRNNPLAGLPLRVGLVLGVSSSPLLGLLAGGMRSLGDVVFSVALGAAIAMLGIELVVTQPLRVLRVSIDAWRHGKPFTIDPRQDMPTELRGLGLSFKRATQTLARREAQLTAAIAQQELAMQEIHHRVKNNLQIVASMLNLQASRIRVPAARAEFQSARDRVRALSTLHRHLYAHGEVHTINMRLFLQELCVQLFEAMGESDGDRISLDIEAPEIEMSSDQAVPLSLIVTEAVSNSIKYAYPNGRRGTISVRLRREQDQVELEIQDDGVGITAGRAETEAGTRDGIGIQLINGFARQLGAMLDVEHGVGTRYLVRMKLRRDRLSSPDLRRSQPGRQPPLQDTEVRQQGIGLPD